MRTKATLCIMVFQMPATDSQEMNIHIPSTPTFSFGNTTNSQLS